MSDSDQIAKSIASIIADYRIGEIEPPTPEHVLKWASQFPREYREGVLSEILHVLQRTYISSAGIMAFLERVLAQGRMVQGDPGQFWQDVHFLNIQKFGSSQQDMLDLVDRILKKNWGISRSADSDGASMFCYLDDGIFSGGHVRRDLMDWVQSDAPPSATVHVIVNAYHQSAYFSQKKLSEEITASGKTIDIFWWYGIQVEDRLFKVDESDVLRPTRLPDDPMVRAYANGLRHPPKFRNPGNVGRLKIFSSEMGRSLLEETFLMAGVQIRNDCPGLNQYQRPLGNSVLETLGFGSMIVTFRNCPNNAPLALWAGEPWYPLFPRRTNSATSFKKMLDEILW